MTELQIGELVYVHGHIGFPDGPKLVRGWGKVNAPGDLSANVELASGLVGDDWAEIGGSRFYAEEDDDRVGTIIVIARDDVFTTEETGFGDPEGRPNHIPTEERKAAFLKVVEATGLDFDGELEQYEGGRYVVMCYDGELGTFREANTLEDLAACIGDLLESAFAFGGWYDLEDGGPYAYYAGWAVTVSRGEDHGSAEGTVFA